MGFEVNNTPDVPYIDQAEPDAGDFRALGYRNSGVVSGMTVSAVGSSGMAVSGSGGSVIINGQTYDVAPQAAISIAPADNAPRFDLVGVSAAAPTVYTVIKGAPSSNPRFPAFEPRTFTLCAVVYVRSSTTSILVTDVVDKRIFVEQTFSRTYGVPTLKAIDVGVTGDPNRTSITADGTISWASSTLRRTGEKAMEFATSLVVKAVDAALPVIIAKATANTVAERLLSVRASNDVEKAYIDGTGQAFFENFKFGNGSPNGSVAAPKGALYIDRTAPRNAALWLHEGADGTATSWVAFRVYDPAESALPVGSIISWSGDPLYNTTPTGFIYGNGQYVSDTDPTYAALFNIIGYRWGQGVNTFRIPFLSGRMLAGRGGTRNFNVADLLGDYEAALDIKNMPYHDHELAQEPHVHPMPGLPYIWTDHDPSQIKIANAQDQPLAVPSAGIWPLYFPNEASVDISVEGTGGDPALGNNVEPFDVLNPIAVVSYLIKI